MSMNVTRINIQIDSEEKWNALKTVDFERAGISSECVQKYNNEYIIDGDWSATSNESDDLVKEIVRKVGKDIVVIAYHTDLNTDEEEYCVFCLGSRLRRAAFSDWLSESDKADMFHKTDIDDIEDWVRYGEFRISAKELTNLHKYGYFKDLAEKPKKNRL